MGSGSSVKAGLPQCFFGKETESFDRGISLIFPGKACHKQGKPLSITKEKALLS